MIFNPSNTYNDSILIPGHHSLIFNGKIIERVKVIKYLGIMIDENLNWDDHIKYVANKISSIIGILFRYRNNLTLCCKKVIYFAFFYSVVVYGIEIYGSVPRVKLKPISLKCNRLLRILLCKPLRTPLHELYSSLNTLPIELLFEYHTFKFIHTCVWNSYKLPPFISSWFIRNNIIHSHNTRQKHNFFINSEINRKSIQFYGPVMWAKLPSSLTNDSSLNSFLNNCKTYLLNKK